MNEFRPRPSLLDEGLISLADAARLLPRRRGKKVSTSTVWRWAVRGHQGVKLEYAELPSGFVTSKPAITRFMEALKSVHEQEGAGLDRLGDALRSDSARELDRLGIRAIR